MAAFSYSPFVKLALDLLKQFGAPIVVRRVSGGTFDRASGSYNKQPDIQEETVNGIKTKYTEDALAGVLIEKGDRIYLLDSSFQPHVGDKLVLASEPWEVMSVEPIAPGPTIVANYVMVRK